MTDDIAIIFTADISELQRGLQQAADGVRETTAAMKAGAEQLGSSFAAVTQAYAAGVAQRLDLVRGAETEELAVARAGDRERTDLALDAIRMKQTQVREEVQLSQLSHDEERTAMLQLESEREQLEARHLVFLQGTYRDNATAYANVQRQIDELAAQSALRRQQIERTYLSEVYADYRRTFEQIGSSVSQQVMGMIRGQETFRQAVQNVALSIVQNFIQARIKAVADWAAGVAAETTITSAGEAAKTGAVVAGTATRTAAQQAGAATGLATTVAAILKSIVASASETFAGIFGFLSPLMGPAAAGPAAAGQATVMAAGAALPSFDSGAWSLPADMIAQVHRGEMIVPAGPATAFREASGQGSGVTVHHQTSFNVTAMDSRDVARFLRGHGRPILDAINEAVRHGAHLGLRGTGRR